MSPTRENTEVRIVGIAAQGARIVDRVTRARVPSVVATVAIGAQSIRPPVRTVATAEPATVPEAPVPATQEQPTRASLQIMATGVQARQTMLEAMRRARAMRIAGTDARTARRIEEVSARELPLGSQKARRPASNSRLIASKSGIPTA